MLDAKYDFDFEVFYRHFQFKTNPITGINRTGWHISGYAFKVDGSFQWIIDPSELLQAGKWLASNEKKFRLGYRTTRKDCGFAVVFNHPDDAAEMGYWLFGEDHTVDEVTASLRLHRRRSKLQQLPGSGDRAWSARFDVPTLRRLRFKVHSPFSHENGEELYLPVAGLAKYTLEMRMPG